MAPYFFRRRLKLYGIVGLLFFILAYFIYHMIQGDHGLRAWVGLKTELVAVEAKLAETRATHDYWASRVDRLRNDHVDPDLLEETSREVLHTVPRDGVLLRVE